VARGVGGSEQAAGRGGGRAVEQQVLDADVVVEPLEMPEVRRRGGDGEVQVRGAVRRDIEVVGGRDRGDPEPRATGEDSVQVFAAPGATSAPLRVPRPSLEQTDPRWRGRVTAAFALGCGVLVGASGPLVTHATWRGEVNETVTGILITLAALGFLLATRARRPSPSARSPEGVAF
jgi:hypothetical protein